MPSWPANLKRLTPNMKRVIRVLQKGGYIKSVPVDRLSRDRMLFSHSSQQLGFNDNTFWALIDRSIIGQQWYNQRTDVSRYMIRKDLEETKV